MSEVMGLDFLALGLIMFPRPDCMKTNSTAVADHWKQGSWHPYKMPHWGLRVAGLVIVAVAALFPDRLYRVQTLTVAKSG